MNQMVQGFLDNDSFFGRFMTKLGIIIAANIMFMLLSIPFFTIGAGLSALYYVMFRTLRSDGGVNPFKEFWAGLKMNFKQATISWILFVLLIAFLLVDIRICNAAGGTLGYLKIGAYAIGAVAVILYLYLIPVMAAFQDSLPHLIRNDLQMLPLYAFLWVLCGFGLQAMLGATLLLPEFEPYLTPKEEDRKEDPPEGSTARTQTQEEILEDMQKLGM